MLLNKCRKGGFGEPRPPRHNGHLIESGRAADVRVKAGPRCRHKVPRDRRCITSKSLPCFDAGLHVVDELRIRRTQIGRTARSSVVGNGLGTGLEKGRLCPILSDQAGSDNTSVMEHEGPGGLIAHHRLGNTGRKCRIKEASDRGQEDEGDGCLEETFAKTDRCGRVRGGHIHYFLKNVDHHVNQLDPSKGNNDAAEAVYQQIVLKKTSG